MAKRVIVVDDNRDAADSTALLIRLKGHEVSTANDGETALIEAERHRPQVMLVDIGLPRMDGFEVARRLRETYGRSLLLIAVTGWGEADDLDRSQEAGFDHHLVKPIDPITLFKLLDD